MFLHGKYCRRVDNGCLILCQNCIETDKKCLTKIGHFDRLSTLINRISTKKEQVVLSFHVEHYG